MMDRHTKQMLALLTLIAVCAVINLACTITRVLG